MPPQPEARNNFKKLLRSFFGVLRLAQVLLGLVLWAIIAASKYDGPMHYVLLVAVLFWLLALATFVITLMGKQDLVPLVGGERWLLSNTVHDLAAAVLYLPAVGVMVYKTERTAYCNLEHYRHPCPYKAYLAATVTACLCTAAYLLSGIYNTCRKCRGEHAVV